MAGRKSKYETHVLPKLFLVECWARDGLTDAQIAKKLCVSVDSFYKYKNEFSEFSESLKKGKEIVDYEVENALLERAKGGVKQLTRPFKLKRSVFDEKGKKVEEREFIEYATHEEYVPPDTTAIIFWLKNRKPDVWKDKPIGDANTGGQLESLIKGLIQNE